MSSHEADGNGNSFIRITNREIYDALRKLEATMAELVSQRAIVEEQGKRIRALEIRWYGVVAGIVGALSTIIYAIARGK